MLSGAQTERIENSIVTLDSYSLRKFNPQHLLAPAKPGHNICTLNIFTLIQGNVSCIQVLFKYKADVNALNIVILSLLDFLNWTVSEMWLRVLRFLPLFI